MAAIVTSVLERVWPFFCQSRRNRPACRGIAAVTGKTLRAVQENVGLGLLAGPKAGINLRDVDRATREHMPLLNELVQELGAAKPPVEVIEDDRGVDEEW